MYKITKKIVLSLFLLVFSFSNAFNLFAKPKNNDSETSSESSGIYKKYIHPREYVFDLVDAKGKISLKYDNASGKAYGNVDFTELVKDQMPRKGDKVTFTYEGTSNRDLKAITAQVYDLTKGVNLGSKVPEIVTTAVSKKQVFKKSFSLILNDDAENSITLRLTATFPDDAKKIDKVDLSFKRTANSTNIKKEMEEEKLAIKNGLKVVRVKSNFTIIEKKVQVPVTSEENNKEEETKASQIEVTPQNKVEVSAPQVEEELNFDETLLGQENDAEKSEEAITEAENADTDVEEEADEEPEEEQIVEEIIIEEEIILPDEIESDIEVMVSDEAIEDDLKLVEESITSLISEEEPVELVNSEKVEEGEPEPIPEKVVIKVEPQISQEKTKEAPVEAPKEETEKPEPIIIKNKVSRYAKEYLQDYMVMDELEISEPESTEVEKISNPDKKDKDGKTLLMVAAKKGDKEKIKQLIYSGADVNLKDKQGWTALMYAARYQKDLNCLDLIIEAGAEIKEKNKYGLSALVFAACYNTNPQILGRLISYYSPSDKEVLKSFVLLLSECSNPENIQIAKANIMINNHVPVNSFYNGKTPLMYASEYSNSTKLIRVLLENNANISLRSTEGKTAFDYASANSKLEHDNVYWTLNKK